MGRVDYHRQGPDADPLQARDHHVRFCWLQYLAVRSVFSDCARRPVLRGCDPAQPLRRMDPDAHREAFGPMGRARHRRARARVRHRVSDFLNQPRSARLAASMSHPTLDISMARPDYLMIAQARSKVTGAMLAASLLLVAAGEA